MSTFVKNNKGESVEYPPYQCKVCGMYEVEHPHDICRVCGWQDDGVQNRRLDYESGANYMSFNQYREIWKSNKEELLALSLLADRMNFIKSIYKKQKK